MKPPIEYRPKKLPKGNEARVSVGCPKAGRVRTAGSAGLPEIPEMGEAVHESGGKPMTGRKDGHFDRNAYQREYMRKWRKKRSK